jgi:hypothetical protein
LVAILQALFSAYSFIIIWSIEDTLLAELSKLLILQASLPQIFGLYGTQLLRQTNITYRNVLALSLALGAFAGALASLITQSFSVFSIIFLSVVTLSISFKLRSDEKLISGALIESFPRLVVLSLIYFFNGDVFYNVFHIIFIAIFLIVMVNYKAYIQLILSFDLRRQLNFSSSNGLKVVEGVLFPIFVPQELLAMIIRCQTLLRPAELLITGMLRQFEITIIDKYSYQLNVSRIASLVFVLSGILLSIIYSYGINIFNVQITTLFFIQVSILHVLKIAEYSLGFPGIRIRRDLYIRSLEIFLKATLKTVAFIGVALYVYSLCSDLSFGNAQLLDLLPFVIFGSITVVYKIHLWLSYGKFNE